MIIQKNSKEGSGISPDALAILSSEFTQTLHHLKYGFKHPLALYNVLFAEILDNFQSVLDTVNSVMLNKPFLNVQSTDWEEALTESEKKLLYSLMEHLDDCDHILQSFFSPSIQFAKHPSVKRFKKATSQYRDHLGRLVNYIKHSQGRLRAIVLSNDQFGIPGYFAEGPDKTGSLGPALHIHAGGNTTFSFTRDLRFHLYGLYMVSKHLGDTIDELVSNNRMKKVDQARDESKLVQMIDGISHLPLKFFPNENALHIPSISLIRAQDNTVELTISYPDSQIKVEHFSFDQISLAYRTDGVTRAYRLPYGSMPETRDSMRVYVKS